MKPRIPLFERLIIESQSNCNRTCWFCPRTYDRSGVYLDHAAKPVQKEMPTEKILDLLDQAQGLGFRKLVGFHHYSEPLLDKRNPTLAREARKRGMQPYLHTNGDVLMRNDELCESIKGLYEKIVIGLYDYETTEQLEDAKRFWSHRLAGARLTFSAIGLSGARTGYSMVVPKALVPPDPRIAVPDLTYTNAPCRRPLIRMIIRYDGAICNCCEDTEVEFDLGNAYQNSLEDLWYSERHVNIVEDLIAGHRANHGLCRYCPLSPSGPAPNGKQITFKRRQSR